MIATQYNKAELVEMLEQLPDEIIAEVIDFGKYLTSQYPQKSGSQIDERALLLQQNALSKIWDDPEENVYEL